MQNKGLIIICLLLVSLYSSSIHFLIIRQKVDYLDIILINFQFLFSYLAISQFIGLNKKNTLKKSRLRLQKHINERKALMRKFKDQGQERNNRVLGYPWWPWFK